MTAARRHAEEREQPAVVGFQRHARFTSIVADENPRRFYLLTWQPSLFGGGMLVRSWGRLGSHSTSRAAAFPDRESAQEAVARLICRRIRRRYELTDWT
jgi:predicted DNA-binding WGR domain protein